MFGSNDDTGAGERDQNSRNDDYQNGAAESRKPEPAPLIPDRCECVVMTADNNNTEKCVHRPIEIRTSVVRRPPCRFQRAELPHPSEDAHAARALMVRMRFNHTGLGVRCKSLVGNVSITLGGGSFQSGKRIVKSLQVFELRWRRLFCNIRWFLLARF